MLLRIVGVILLVVLGVLGYWLWSHRDVAGQGAATETILKGEQIGEGDMYRYGEERPYYKIEVLYPKGRPAVEAALAALIAEFKKNGNLDHLTEEDIKIQNLGGDRKYALSAEYKIFQSSTTVSYLFMIYEDMLGAHPNHYYKSFVFDQEGRQLTLTDLWPSNPNWLEELSLLVSNDVVAQYKARAQVDDVTGLVYPEGLAPKVENFQNFVIDGETLLIAIPPYQVAAYAVGDFEVRIPLKDLQ